MSKKDLNDINYIIAVVNRNNIIPFTLAFNFYKNLKDNLDYKNIKYTIEEEKTKGYAVIKVDLKNYIIELEKDDKNNLKILCIIKKAILKGEKKAIKKPFFVVLI